MINLNALNNSIVQAMAKIQQAATVDLRTYLTLESECAYLTARGKERIYFTDLAIAMTGRYISLLDKIVPEVSIKVFPDKGESQVQSLNATLKMIVIHNTMLDGYIDSKGLETAITHWLETDTPLNMDNEQTLDLNVEQVASDLLTAMINADILSGEEGQARTSDGAYYTAFGITEEVNKDRISTINDLWNNAQPRMQPMRHPLRWYSDGTCDLKNLRLIGGYSEELSPLFTQAFNKLGHVAYSINEEIREEVRLIVEANEMPELPEDERQALKVLEKHEIRIKVIEELLELPTNTPLYFPHTADWRGRAYARGGLTQFQSIKECRSMFDFAESVEVKDPTGLFLHVANAHGRDKLSIDNRIKWVKDNIKGIMCREFDEDEGIYATRAAFALREYYETGRTNVICHIDGTCNGTQWTSAIYRDEKTAKLVNVTAANHSDNPQDLYGVIAEAAAKLATGQEKQALLKFGRNLTKAPIMVLGYGASEGTCVDTVNEYLLENDFKANAKKLYKYIELAIKLKAPALVTLTNNLKRILKKEPKHRVEWFVPDMKIVAHNTNTEHLNLYGSMYTGKLLGKALPDCDALARGISPNYVHSLDSAHLRAVVRESSAPLSCIHDSIGAPANEVIRTNEIIREEFWRINKIDGVANIYSALNAKYTDQRKNLNIDEVLKASYIFS